MWGVVFHCLLWLFFFFLFAYNMGCPQIPTPLVQVHTVMQVLLQTPSPPSVDHASKPGLSKRGLSKRRLSKSHTPNVPRGAQCCPPLLFWRTCHSQLSDRLSFGAPNAPPLSSTGSGAADTSQAAREPRDAMQAVDLTLPTLTKEEDMWTASDASRAARESRDAMQAVDLTLPTLTKEEDTWRGHVDCIRCLTSCKGTKGTKGCNAGSGSNIANTNQGRGHQDCNRCLTSLGATTEAGNAIQVTDPVPTTINRKQQVPHKVQGTKMRYQHFKGKVKGKGAQPSALRSARFVHTMD